MVPDSKEWKMYSRFYSLIRNLDSGEFDNNLEDIKNEAYSLAERLSNPRECNDQIDRAVACGIRIKYNNFLKNAPNLEVWDLKSEKYFSDLAQNYNLNLSRLKFAKVKWAVRFRDNGLERISSGDVSEISNLIDVCEEQSLDTQEIRGKYKQKTGQDIL